MSGPYANYKNYSIMLGDLQLPHLPKELEVGADRFIIKEEFHITLINLTRNAPAIGIDDIEAAKAELMKSFYDFVSTTPLTDYQLTDDLRLVNVSDDNKSIVVLVKLTGIDKLFAQLNQKYGITLPVQPTHITLYTLPTDRRGIPIDSYEELERISQPIELPEIKKYLGV